MIFKQAVIAWVFSVCFVAPAFAQSAAPQTTSPLVDHAILGESGLPSLDWFTEASSDLRDDIKGATAKGKLFALVWEQAGCYYCKQMHEVNFGIDEITDFVRSHFELVQMDMHGGRVLTDLKGEVGRETDLARRNRVTGTPTIQFLVADGREVFRMPGYAKPAVFLAAFQYVKEGGYRTLSFRAWVKAEIKRRAKS
ncbi:MAG: thioredoxin fold domain-containing protein [Rhodospirillaceae bacterium]|nr:thioredoxin fold domain-containing protein [Rhodospirillaceae bacterium]MBT5812348.1 thioredoxin fold domain-containing protein [Rhodospirillaceae bacterium]